ncbi:probable inactive serine/threonine-protein kinase fnkC [Momordica charantia]|uniref:Probable inactive serine/threonine-protein kinase fnkC n=1 Tax=Momordica charantia TaxID=3673 RepID=A0A6J1CJ46_MOMCH|nr:probable inactive serine/threonine-protein kinase fnkC [Momordica charantia]
MTIMDDRMSYVDPIKDQQHEIIRSTRIEPPTHYTFKINSYSVLSKIGMEKCESGDFEVDGYKWKLILHPNGDDKVEDHISLYLAISSKGNQLPLGWEVRVIFRFLIFDQIRDNYLTIQDGKVRKYSKMKNEHGITHLLSHNALNEASNGFVVDDSCTFGVELSVLKVSNKGESLSIIKEPQLDHFIWYIYPFSSYTGESYTSQPFTVKGRKWRMRMYPNGSSVGKATNLSIYLKLDESENIPIGKKIYAKYFLGIYNFGTKKYFEKSDDHWFTSSTYGSGFPEFLALKDLKDSSKSYVQTDGLFLKARIVAMSTVEEF